MWILNTFLVILVVKLAFSNVDLLERVLRSKILKFLVRNTKNA